MALYSGLGAGIVAVVILVVAVMLYRKSHSDYGVDVIDSSALTGGFQSFNFKTTRQGEATSSPYLVCCGVEKRPAVKKWRKCTISSMISASNLIFKMS